MRPTDPLAVERGDDAGVLVFVFGSHFVSLPKKKITPGAACVRIPPSHGESSRKSRRVSNTKLKKKEVTEERNGQESRDRVNERKKY